MLNRKIFVSLLSFFLLLLVMISLFGDVVGDADGFKIIGGTDDVVWWNTTELSTESYTAPFFEVYKLKDLGQAAYGLDVADFNDDGYLDFVVNWATSPWDDLAGISVFYGQNDNCFLIQTINTHDWKIEDVKTADFDLDGDFDFLISKYYGNDNFFINVLWNDNDSFFRENDVAYFNRVDGYWINPHISVADFDVDGDVDFLVGANCGKVKLFKNDGLDNFSDEGVIFDYGIASWGLDTGDFNDDGFPDFIVCAQTDSGEYPFGDAGHIYLKLNDGSDACFNLSDPGVLIASIPFPFDYTIGAGVFGSVAVLDYNDDGLLDVLYAGDYKIFLIMQQPDGSFVPFYAVGLRGRELDWSDRLHQGGFSVGDFNGDGLDDVVVGGVQGDVRLLINNQTLVNVVKPEDRLLYFFGNDDYSLRFPGTKVVVGGIEVVAQGLEPLSRVDFYVDGVLVKSDDVEPFSWDWTTLGFKQYKVCAEAFDFDGDFAGRDSFLVWKFL